MIGYQGEPYLWFRPDGTVAENQRSPSTFLNASRYGDEPPVSASADEAPEWRDVADDGSFEQWSGDIEPLDPLEFVDREAGKGA